tara:strand:+ start:514 stop:1116 length:603 start_codon:yes stop_codon:yes gene_type:complete
MAENKKSFVLYTDSQGLVNQLPDDVAGRLLKHIYAYVNDENPITDELLIKIAFEPIKMQLKRDLVKWEQTLESRSKAGKASAEAKRLLKENQQNSTNLTSVDFVQQSSTNSTVNDNVNVNVNDIYYKELLISESWIEINAKNNRTTPDKVKLYLTKFNNNLIAQGEKKNNKREYQSHFARWLPIELAKEVKDKPKFTPLI